jgi:methionyl-tRNA synthetase
MLTIISIDVKKNILITTSIAYANGAPHLGFAMETIEADVIARWHRSRGNNVYFLTGTDENGIKNYQTAKAEGLTTPELVNRNSAEFKRLIDVLNISIDDFIRTTEQRHVLGAQHFWKRIEQNGDLIARDFTGLYCVGCETFLTEKELTEAGECPNHLKKPEEVSEKNIFFKLSNYNDFIIDALESKQITIEPDFRKNEILSLAKEEGLKDVSFSRPKTSLPWGITVPGDEQQVMYVWCDALTNYITALGYGQDDQWKEYWQDGEVIHFIGKDILRFHAGIWPAMLKSAGLPLPKKICVHGFLTSEGHKMSKSLGNIVDPFAMVEEFDGNPDPLRYFLLAEVPFGRDADFSRKRFEEIYNAKLANGIGNLFSRVLTLAEKGGGVAVPQQPNNQELGELVAQVESDGDRLLASGELHLAVQSVFGVVEYLNGEIDRVKPWVNMKQNPESENDNIADWLWGLEQLAKKLSIFLPHTAEIMLTTLKTREKTTLFPRLPK